MADDKQESVLSVAMRAAERPIAPVQSKHLRPVLKAEGADERGPDEATALPAPIAYPAASAPPRPADPVAGGFAAIAPEFERRSREWAGMARVLEQNRQHLEVAERERDAAYAKLARVMPMVQETAQALKSAMESRKAGETTGDIDALFSLNGRSLDELEKTAASLSATLVWCKTAWEQYTRSVEAAQRLRPEGHRERAA